jgi:TonB-linked SusC/RagA family outer membrane protein
MSNSKANTISQNKKVTLKVSKKSISEIFAAISKQTEYKFFYNSNQLDLNRKLNLKVVDQNVTKVLSDVLKGTNCDYEIYNNQIIIKTKKNKSTAQEQKETIIRGKVTDKKGNPLPGVTVMIKGTVKGVATNIKGEFAINSPKAKGEIVFSFIGYKTKTQTYSGKTQLNVKLEVEHSDIDEVTIVAYGQQRKREITGAVSTLDAGDLKDIPVSNIASLLQGKIAGVDVTLMSGAPGSSKVSTTVRGYNEIDGENRNYSNPLWVVDGVPIDNMQRANSATNVLSEIDPEMIESIQVLKDAASTSLYGSRAANGVILINTKMGRKGKTKFKVNMSQSFSWLPEYPTIVAGNEMRRYAFQVYKNSKSPWRSYDGKEMEQYQSYEDAYFNPKDHFWQGSVDKWWGTKFATGNTNATIQDSLDHFYNNSTNWPKYLFNTGKITNINVQASGGNDKILYNFGMGYYKEKGIVSHTGFDRANVMANMKMNIRKNLHLNFRTFASYIQRDNSNSFSLGKEDINEDIPNWPYENSSFLPGKGSKIYDIRMNSLTDKDEDLQNYSLRSSVGIDWEILKGLSFQSNNSINLNLYKRHSFIPGKYNWRGDNYSSDYWTLENTLLNETILTWAKSIDETHNIELLAGTSYQKNIRNSISAFAKRGPNDNIRYIIEKWPNLYKNPENMGGNYEALQEAGTAKYESVLISFFGRLNYNYKKKYLLSATIRRDGSSKFGKAKPWGNFPSISAGWAFTEEDFMKSIAFIDFGKIRGSYGVTGKNYSREYLAYGLYEAGQKYNFDPTMRPGMLHNPDLTWEETKQHNIGLDLDLLNYRLGLNIDFYRKTSDKMLMSVSTPGDYNGASAYTKNSGKLTNEGVELSLKFDVLRNDDFFYRINFNIARNWNKFKDTYNHRDYGSFIIGRPVKGIYVYEEAGIAERVEDIPYVYEANGDKKYLNDGFQSFLIGDMLYVDQNNDNVIDGNDQIYKGSPLPKAVGGMLHEFKWKNFDLSCYLSFSIGKTLSNSAIASALSPLSFSLDKPILVDPRGYTYWQKPGDAGKVDLPTGSVEGNFLNYNSQTDRYLKEVNYMKLKSLTVGYSLPKNITRKIGIDKARAFVSGENLFTITNFNDVDPEAISLNSGSASLKTYPLARKLTIGLTINL